MLKVRVAVSPSADTFTVYWPGGEAGPRCGCAAHMIMPGNTMAPCCRKSHVKRFMPCFTPTCGARGPKKLALAAGRAPAAGPSASPVNERSTAALAIEEVDLHLVGVLREEVVEGDVRVEPALRVDGFEEVQGSVRDLRRRLAQHADVVEHVEAAPVRADHQVALLDDDAVHRRDRKVEPQRLPAGAVGERDVDAVLGAEIEQPPALGILADCAREVACRGCP